MKKISIIVLLILIGQFVMAQDKPDAVALWKVGKFKEAEQVCLDELKVTPKNIYSYIVLGWTLLSQKRYADALKYSQEGMKITRNNKFMMSTAGEALLALGRNREALKYFEDYTVYYSTDPKIKNIYYSMGEIFIRLGEFRNADIAFSTAVHYDSKNGLWWARLGYAREIAKDYEWSLDAYNKALQLAPRLREAILGKERVSKLLAS